MRLTVYLNQNQSKMKKLLLLVGLMPLASFAQQDYNPFEAIGKKVTVVTLSNGRYKETYGGDTVKRIGNVMFDIRTNKVVKFLEENDTTTYEFRKGGDLSTRWLSIDPLAAKYPYLSPYVFVNNSPIFLKDPDGKEFFVAITNDKGKVVAIYPLNATDVKEAHLKQYETVVSALTYLSSTKNENAKNIYADLSKAVEKGGPRILLVSIPAGALNIEHNEGEGYVEQEGTPDGLSKETYHVAEIDFSTTNAWKKRKSEDNYSYQSSAVEFGAHEIGHKFQTLVEEAKNGNFSSFGKDLVGKYKKEFGDGQPGYPSFNEYFAVKVQNLFAEGLNEPIKPNKNPADVGYVVDKKSVQSPTESSR